jgi:membrane dipeptidase
MEPGGYGTAVELYKAATVCDMTLPFGEGLEGREEALERFFKSGITYVSLTVGSDWGGTGVTVHNIADVQAMIRTRNDRMMVARTVDDIRTAKQLGKLAVGFHFQGSLPLESNPNLVGLYYELGVRQMLLVFNVMNAAGSGCLERVDAGLSGYGLRLIRGNESRGHDRRLHPYRLSNHDGYHGGLACARHLQSFECSCVARASAQYYR